IWTERLWLGLPRFAWQCSLRTWAYTLARNASTNYQRDARVRARHQLPLPASSELSRIEQQVRTETRTYMRTEAKAKPLAMIHDLPLDDRLLLMRRLDKRLEWKNLARVMLDEGAPVTDELLARTAQRLRKRFQLLKDKLVEAGRREGILGSSGDR